jgi:hypothetical protein
MAFLRIPVEILVEILNGLLIKKNNKTKIVNFAENKVNYLWRRVLFGILQVFGVLFFEKKVLSLLLRVFKYE